MAASDKSVTVSFTTDFSSDSTASDGWQELTKSDYAKVIFSDLLCNTASGTVECKFQITDNVHEDPSDYVGLFRIGYEDLSQCLVSKMLSQTKCEDDGKLQRCVFTNDELPHLDDGFYQFLYVTRDQEVCGASMPFQIKMSPLQLKENAVESCATEKMDGGFLLVSNEMEKRRVKETSLQENAPVQQSPLSEQKKEEIAAWVSQNPDYYSLIEQIKEHTFTIDALQQSKDLAMKEVAQLYEILNTQNGELIQLKTMIAAYEEKIKMSQSLQEEKNNEIVQMRDMLTAHEVRMFGEQRLHEKKNIELKQMETSLAASEEKLQLQELLQKEKDEQLNRIKKEYLQLENKLKINIAFQNQQQTEINNLKKELEDMKEMQKAKECQATAEMSRCSMETLKQKAQDLVCIFTDTIKSIDFTDEDEVENFFQFKIHLLIIWSKMTRATDLANICNRNGLHKTAHSIIEKNVKRQRSIIPTTSSVEPPQLPDSSVKELVNEVVLKEVSRRIPFKKVFGPEVLEHQIVELPRLGVINEDTATTLQTDRPLDTEDITVINRLTEKMIQRGYNLFEAIELVDDSSSDSGSDDVSEISECSSSIKKDLLCVGRVMQALSSSLSNQTYLEQLVVVKNEEDKNLLCKNEWNVLLQKCALHYQIEILLEHIEKQKEGMKKVSDKICELLTKCMLLKDEVCESKTVCEKLQTVIDKRDMLISKLKEELELKNSLLSHFCNEKEELLNKAELAEKTVDDFHARLMEASNLYKKQYKEIEKLSKRIRKYKSANDMIKTSKEETSLTSSESSKNTSSFEVVHTDLIQNVNDSDTGEHMFEKASLVSNKLRGRFQLKKGFLCNHCCEEKNQVPKSSTIHRTPSLNSLNREVPDFETEASTVKHKAVQEKTDSNKEMEAITGNCSNSCLNPLDDLQPSTHELKSEKFSAVSTSDKLNAETVECKSYETASVFSNFASYEHFQEIIKQSFANMKKPTASKISQECSIFCYFCNEVFPLGPEDPTDLMNHLESEHRMKICPVCGQLFEEAIPPKYFHIHVDRHFETE